jgi:hypothetical protein
MNHHMLGAAADRQPRLLAPDEPEVEDIIKIGFEIYEDRRAQKVAQLPARVLAIGTRELDPRVLAQQGAFTIHSDSADLATVEEGFRQWRLAYLIPKSQKPGIRELLSYLSIHKSTLFPDLGALAEDLRTWFYLGRS